MGAGTHAGPLYWYINPPRVLVPYVVLVRKERIPNHSALIAGKEYLLRARLSHSVMFGRRVTCTIMLLNQRRPLEGTSSSIAA